MTPRSYLCLGGVEIANEMRTLSYLLRGLAGPEFEVSTNDTANPAGAVRGYSDVYTDIYEGDVSFASMLACYCADLDDPSNFVSPAADPAPWYDASLPGAGDFLGVLFDTVDMGVGSARSLAARASGGSSIGRSRLIPRTVAVHGRMFASSPRGMEYGQRWLTQVLGGSMCGDCGGDTAELLPVCGDGATGTDTAFRSLYEVGLIDGPFFTPFAGPNGPGFRMQEFAFQLSAGNPYLHRPFAAEPTLVALSAPGESVSVPIVTSEWSGEVAVTIDIEAVAGDLAGLSIIAVPMLPDQPCAYDPDLTANVCARYTVNGLGNGDVLTIDASSRRVRVFDSTSKSTVSGFARLTFDVPFPWLIVPPCSTVCLTLILGDTGHANVTIRTEEREL